MPQSTIEQAKATALQRLLAIPGVTGVGIGPKIVGGSRTGEFAIMVFTQAKKPLDQIPLDERIPSEIHGYKTDVVEAGLPVKLSHVPLEPLADDQKYAILRGGVGISVEGSSGTLGCIAVTTSSYVSGAGRVVLLTNHHVLFSDDPSDVTPHCNKSVGQPGQTCCCPACDFWFNVVAHVRANGVASHFVDGATAELKPGTVWRPEIEDEDASGNPVPIPIAGVVSPDLTKEDIAGGYAVWKRGATTRKTTGNIISVDYTAGPTDPLSILIAPDPSCPYPTTNKDGFTPNQVVFSYPGDSGSILLNQSNQVVGLVYGGTTSGGYGVACAIGHVQDELKIAIKTVANTPAGDQTTPATNDTAVKPQPKLPLDDRNLQGPPSNVVLVAGRRGSEARLEALLRTPRGQEYVGLALQHQEELLRLVNTNRRVATVWHRNGGPTLLRWFTDLHDDLRLPDTINGQPLEVRLKRIADIFERYGSDRLGADIETWRPRILALAHCSFKEAVDSLAQDCAHAG
jgi:hypothetical protein